MVKVGDLLRVNGFVPVLCGSRVSIGAGCCTGGKKGGFCGISGCVCVSDGMKGEFEFGNVGDEEGKVAVGC